MYMCGWDNWIFFLFVFVFVFGGLGWVGLVVGKMFGVVWD